jgi:hypothetical protein
VNWPGIHMTSLDLTVTRVAAARNAPLILGTRVLCVLFFFSGFSALSWQTDLLANAGGKTRSIEPCPDLVARTTGKRLVTDNNMGSEWPHDLGRD